MVWGRLYEPCEHWLRGASGSSQHQSEVAETGAVNARDGVRETKKRLPLGDG